MARKCDCDWMLDALTRPDMLVMPLASRGLWVALVNAMRSLPNSVLRIGSRFASPKEIAKMIAIDESELEANLQPLLDANLLAREADGALFCPLMAATSSRSEINRINGLKGGEARRRQAAERRQGNILFAVSGGAVPSVGESKAKANDDVALPTAKLLASSSLEAESKPRVHAQSPEVLRIGNLAIDAAGFDPARWSGTVGVVAEWLNAGADEATIVETIRAKARPDVRSLRYFGQAIAEAVQRGGVVVRTQAGAAFEAALREWEFNGRNGPLPRLADFQQQVAA